MVRDEAEKRYRKEWDDVNRLLPRQDDETLTVAVLANEFLTAKRARVGRLSCYGQEEQRRRACPKRVSRDANSSHLPPGHPG